MKMSIFIKFEDGTETYHNNLIAVINNGVDFILSEDSVDESKDIKYPANEVKHFLTTLEIFH